MAVVWHAEVRNHGPKPMSKLPHLLDNTHKRGLVLDGPGPLKLGKKKKRASNQPEVARCLAWPRGKDARRVAMCAQEQLRSVKMVDNEQEGHGQSLQIPGTLRTPGSRRAPRQTFGVGTACT